MRLQPSSSFWVRYRQPERDGPLPALVRVVVIVAESLASEEPPSRIVMSVAPTVGDLGEVTYDVVGIGDDAVRGFRLHVFATPDEGGEGFVLKSVEQTVLCGRGLSGVLCV